MPIRPSEVYPRACGGTAGDGGAWTTVSGLSPRLRGNPNCCCRWRGWERSIPAPAGEPRTLRCWTNTPGVYPRACGGTRRSRALPAIVSGLSPRLWGNRSIGGQGFKWQRSIPAPAGEPCLPPARCGVFWVYPRACGGTGCGASVDREECGLSPRLRGNPLDKTPGFDRVRSIPAPAGEPPP